MKSPGKLSNPLWNVCVCVCGTFEQGMQIFVCDSLLWCSVTVAMVTLSSGDFFVTWQLLSFFLSPYFISFLRPHVFCSFCLISLFLSFPLFRALPSVSLFNPCLIVLVQCQPTAQVSSAALVIKFIYRALSSSSGGPELDCLALVFVCSWECLHESACVHSKVTVFRYIKPVVSCRRSRFSNRSNTKKNPDDDDDDDDVV